MIDGLFHILSSLYEAISVEKKKKKKKTKKRKKKKTIWLVGFLTSWSTTRLYRGREKKKQKKKNAN